MRRVMPIAVLVAALLAGCGGSSSTSAPATSEKPVSTTATGGKAFQPSGGDYELTIPSGWTALDRAKVADLIRSGSTTDFTPEEIQRFASLIAKPGSMFALDDTEAGRQSRRDTSFATNVLLVRSPTTYTGSDDSLRAEAASQIEQQVSSTSAATSRARRQDGAMLGSQPATTLEYDLKVNGTPVIEVDYVTARDGVLYQFSCTAPQDRYADVRRVCDEVAASFRFTG